MARQVSNEQAVLHLAAALKDYDDCNPEVGMGPSFDSFVMQAAKQFDLAPTDYDHARVVDLLRSRSR